MRRTVRRTSAATAAAALLLTLGACSEDEPSASEESTSESTQSGSATPTEDPTTEDTSTADPAAGGEQVDAGDFVDDMKAGLERSTTAEMTMTSDFGGTGFDAAGEVDYTTTPVSMVMTIAAGVISQDETELRLVDGVMYVNLGSMSNDKFVKFDLDDPKSLPPGMEGLAGQMDPLAAFADFEPAVKSVTLVGTEDVDGDQLEHYAVVLDTRRMKSMRELPPGVELPPEVGYDLWFDEEFRMRRMEMVMDLAQQPVTIEAELSGWGEPVDIEAPPASQVAKAPTA